MAGKRNLVKAAEAGEAWNSARQLRALGSRIAQLADRWHGSKERGPGVSTRTRVRAGTHKRSTTHGALPGCGPRRGHAER